MTKRMTMGFVQDNVYTPVMSFNLGAGISAMTLQGKILEETNIFFAGLSDELYRRVEFEASPYHQWAVRKCCRERAE